MRVLFLEWNSMGNDFMKKAMEHAGIEVINYDFSNDKQNIDENGSNLEELAKSVLLSNIDFVFSFNFFKIVAMACKACHKKYVSWVYDSPSVQLYSEFACYETNYIFHFDQYEVRKLQNLGVLNVYYLPMAADTEYYDKMKLDTLAKEDRNRYTADVSFVGSMYTEKKQQLYAHLEKLDDYTRGYLDGVLEVQSKLYGINILEEAITNEVEERLLEAAPVQVNPGGFETLPWVYADYFLARKLAAKERFQILKTISEDINHPLTGKKINVKLYTHEKTGILPLVNNQGVVDYYDQSPYVFKGSKINLNISLRSIRSGIPLRAMDIMGCGGFLLSNYQSDFEELFVADEDYVYFDSMNDLQEKISYYLQHDDERKQIAMNGYRKIKTYHSFDERLQAMLSVMENNDK